jgi:hypothetical protein
MREISLTATKYLCAGAYLGQGKTKEDLAGVKADKRR